MLTHDQCVEYSLPRSPNKDVIRARAFEEQYGEGMTELDALEALHPGELERILTEEVERYYDSDLEDATEAMVDEIEADLDAITEEVHEEHADEIAELEEEHEILVARMDAFRQRAEATLERIERALDARAPDLDDYEWPGAEAEGDEDEDPLFDSTRTYIAQMARYKRHQGKSTKRKVRVVEKRLGDRLARRDKAI